MCVILGRLSFVLNPVFFDVYSTQARAEASSSNVQTELKQPQVPTRFSKHISDPAWIQPPFSLASHNVAIQSETLHCSFRSQYVLGGDSLQCQCPLRWHRQFGLGLCSMSHWHTASPSGEQVQLTPSSLRNESPGSQLDSSGVQAS